MSTNDSTTPSATPETAPTPVNPDFRTGLIGIVGRPNVGKSTLMNRLLGQKLAIATPKAQTTRDRIKGIRTYPDWQGIFVDTPGIHEARTKLNKYMVDLAIGTIAEVDLVYLLVDAAKILEKPEATLEETTRICGYLKEAKRPTFLLLNKVDRVKDKDALLPIIGQYAALHTFEEVVPVSGKSGKNLDRLLAATRAGLPVAGPLFAEDDLTDRPMRFIAKEIIREQLLYQLDQELPYTAAVNIIDWTEKSDGLVVIHANIHVARRSHKPIVVGRGAARVREIGEKSRERLERLVERKVYLDLRVKVDEDWLDNDKSLKALGYDEIKG
jgi:GTP-binding protein Era